jgi:hypothetical protein
LLEVTSKEVSGHTVSGEIVFKGPIQDGGNYDFSTTSGDITAQLPNSPAQLTAATFSGHSSDLPVAQDDTAAAPSLQRHLGQWVGQAVHGIVVGRSGIAC